MSKKRGQFIKEVEKGPQKELRKPDYFTWDKPQVPPRPVTAKEQIKTHLDKQTKAPAPKKNIVEETLEHRKEYFKK